jgi:hypothetical protein
MPSSNFLLFTHDGIVAAKARLMPEGNSGRLRYPGTTCCCCLVSGSINNLHLNAGLYHHIGTARCLSARQMHEAPRISQPTRTSVTPVPETCEPAV